MSDVHLINDIDLQNPDGTYNAVIEIPAGTADKWQTDPENGQLYHEHESGEPRVIQFLPYPANYGFIPQTLEHPDLGGDGDPLDVLVLDQAIDKGTVVPVKVLGALKYMDTGQQDHKIIAVPLEGTFSRFNDLDELLVESPDALEIIKTWFANYKEPGRMVFMGLANRAETLDMIQKMNRSWMNFDLSYDSNDD